MLQEVPNCAFSGITTFTTGTYITKSGRYKLIVWIGWVLLTLGCGLLVLFDSTTSVPAWVFITIVSGLGFGCLYSSLPVATQAPQAKAHMAVASALTPFFRTIGQAFGIAIADAIYQNVLKNYLLDGTSQILRQNATNIAKDAASMVVIMKNQTAGSLERTELLASFNKSLHAVWWMLMGISILAGLLSLSIRELSLDRKEGVEVAAAQADPEKGTFVAADAQGGPNASNGDLDGTAKNELPEAEHAKESRTSEDIHKL